MDNIQEKTHPAENSSRATRTKSPSRSGAEELSGAIPDILKATAAAALPVQSVLECGTVFARGSLNAFQRFFAAGQNNSSKVMEGYQHIRFPLDPTSFLAVQQDINEFIEHAIEERLNLLEDLVSVTREAATSWQNHSPDAHG